MGWSQYNAAQRAFEEFASHSQWAVFSSGWPDYLCLTPDGVRLVEVKPRASSVLGETQKVVAKLLSDAGIRYERWSPDAGFSHWSVQPEVAKKPRKIPKKAGRWISCEVCGTARRVYRYGKYCGNACSQKAKRLRGVRSGRGSGIASPPPQKRAYEGQPA